VMDAANRLPLKQPESYRVPFSFRVLPVQRGSTRFFFIAVAMTLGLPLVHSALLGMTVSGNCHSGQVDPTDL
jgi:hypothetical protein